ncbi:ABC1 kinase family protein [Paraliomyxa miuraensis]|uniref:ABC1 kinase family protein n=1 Tax=Paraliomyxa miuraensis TaxID=376150 RepID=UPI002254DB16|nr:AarF/ABC1/UbiB kinase family protein [Paraliomyxa miuraensis]MCX4243449.1 AarF/ABC1/UbiB kinase family protein [Paraliomyxa miuraensis]
MTDDDDVPLRELARGFRKRTMVTVGLASRVGLGFAKRSLLGRGKKEPEAPSPVEDSAAVEAASKLVKELGALKGLVMKLGQVASYMPGALPPEAQRVLTKLQANTTAMEHDKVRAVIRQELGDEPEALFEQLEPQPFAAASIGQVHRARFEGRDVAVKVQYPGIEDALRSDLKTFGTISRVGTIGTALDGRGLVDELRDRVLEECDYVQEAQSQQRFAELFSTMPGARVPAVVPERSSRRVLTSELDPGQSFYPFCDQAPQAARDRAGEIIFRTCFDSLFRHSIYNADPHPGNYLFSPEGDVTFLDFGCIRRFDPQMIEAWKRVARSVLDDDRAAFLRHFPALGFVGNPKKFDWEHQWGMMHYLYRPFMATEPFTYTHEYVKESYGMLLFDNPNRFQQKMPPEWLFLNRLQWGLNSVLAHLGATAPWGEIWRAGVHAPTVPPAF